MKLYIFDKDGTLVGRTGWRGVGIYFLETGISLGVGCGR